MSLTVRALFILVLFMASHSAWARHSVRIAYLKTPELQTRFLKVLARHGYTYNPKGEEKLIEHGIADFDGEAQKPSPEFLVDLFFHTFMRSVRSVAPQDGHVRIKFNISEDLSRAELAQLFADLQANGAWIEYARLIPNFNFVISLEPSKKEQILKTLEKYEYIDQYETYANNDSETSFIHDPKRRGVSTIKITMMVPNLTKTILEEIPADVLALCVHQEQPGDEFDRLILSCPNEFKILEQIYEAIDRFEVHQTIRISAEGEYSDYAFKRNTAHIFEEHEYKRLVLEPRRERAIELAQKSADYAKLVEISKPDELSMKTFEHGIILLREVLRKSGYDIFKMVYRQDEEKNPVQQIFIELPDEGISEADFDKLLEDFYIYPYLDVGLPDHADELKSTEHENCEFFLSKN